MWFEAGCICWEEATQREYRALIDRYPLPLTRGMRMRDVRPLFLQDLYAGLISSGVSQGVVRRIHALFRTIFNFAHTRRLTLSNPTKGLCVPRKITHCVEALSVDQQRRLLKAATRQRDEYLIKAPLFTGMRISEAPGPTWKNVDLDGGRIHVAATLIRSKGEDGTHLTSGGTTRTGGTA